MLDDSDIEEWVSRQRARVGEYLRRHGITDPNVGEWPAFEMAPMFAIWAVVSKRVPGKIGWWAFSGDCPTDYISEDGQCHPRSALRRLLEEWRIHVSFMRRGEQPPDMNFGEHADLRHLGELLEKRTELLGEWVLDDSMWEDR
jgi:hypothetical protein